jgi:hypothetical protein
LPFPAKVHDPPDAKVPCESELKLTVPLGATGAPAPVSVTVEVQVLAWPTVTEAGEQDTEVELVCLARAVTVRFVLPALPVWDPSPP